MTPSLYLSLTKNTYNGKKLTQPQINLLLKLGQMGWEIGPCVGGSVTGAPMRVTNPVSGHTAELDPLIASLVHWVYLTYSTYDWNVPMTYKGTKVAIGTFDRVKLLILNLDRNAYSDFID